MSTPRDDGLGLWTIPNVISFARLLVLTPAFVYALVVDDSPAAALGILIALGVTDWIDGQIARRFRMRSAIGAKLDPIADRISQGIVCIAMTVAGLIPLVVMIVFVAADLLLLAALLVKRPPAVPVSALGRVRTAVLMIGFPLVLLAAAIRSDAPWLLPASVTLVAIGAAMHAIADTTYAVWVFRGTEALHRDAHPDAPSDRPADRS
ncbi:CDP-alcohol phosphatidyltransferase family protein [Galbitalea sp. SE-J8]|uniref:CDP-alcohol phosphatidyltransferase family protein n=1 Tax=Galbitalea sp. SE-J8 TaxID=3054952 RepID=UPI00259CE1CA|nr:CDP-alcohol phosphatidyltransferase family protein [Galbitalea sp. SE-J8]MDM4763419.1 CDP-alcohol phosphatidyltransferase family protein [Galbitalea sp. SE-J8]